MKCRALLRQERQYIERLRSAAVPEASQDLAARLIQHTERLANHPSQPFDEPSRSGVRRGLRITAIAAGTLAVSAGALAGSAYIVAGDEAPQAFVETNDAGVLAGAWTGGQAESAVAPAFKAGSTITLSAAQLEALRDEGWACPELAGMGFRIVSAQATMVHGHPAVELSLESNGHFATIVEEHRPADQNVPGQSTSGQLSVTQGTPWKAVYSTPAAVISYSSDLPAESADDAVPEIVRAGESVPEAPSPEGSESWYPRLLRGLQTLLRPAGL
ncbi:hypothetical protein [Paenarthrobacter nitroguajacolicus]|uniref:hypothetical protein n=1 Tax=Paenarthrobacter nitroguajacolicus TaxID=211146 RepID=UPI00248CB8C5|nr:hypothetical protein [Paenarthrobacter nitroguajacolicus]